MKRVELGLFGVAFLLVLALGGWTVLRAQDVIAPDEPTKVAPTPPKPTPPPPPPTPKPAPEPTPAPVSERGGTEMTEEEILDGTDAWPHAAEGERELGNKLQGILEQKIGGDAGAARQAAMTKLSDAVGVCEEYLKKFPEGGLKNYFNYKMAANSYQLYFYDKKPETVQKALDTAGKLAAGNPGKKAAAMARKLRMQIFRGTGKQAEAIAEAETIMKEFASDQAVASECGYLLYDMYRRASQFDKAQATLKIVADKYPKTDWGMKAQGMLRRSTLTGSSLDMDFTKADGTKFKLSDHRGKVVLITYWATPVAPSVAYMEKLKELNDKYAGQGLVIISVCMDRERDDFQKGLAKLTAPWIQCFDEKSLLSPMATVVGVTAVPSSVLVDRQGKVVALDLEIANNQLARGIVGCLEGK